MCDTGNNVTIKYALKGAYGYVTGSKDERGTVDNGRSYAYRFSEELKDARLFRLVTAALQWLEAEAHANGKSGRTVYGGLQLVEVEEDCGANTQGHKDALMDAESREAADKIKLAVGRVRDKDASGEELARSANEIADEHRKHLESRGYKTIAAAVRSLRTQALTIGAFFKMSEKERTVFAGHLEAELRLDQTIMTKAADAIENPGPLHLLLTAPDGTVIHNGKVETYIGAHGNDPLQPAAVAMGYPEHLAMALATLMKTAQVQGYLPFAMKHFIESGFEQVPVRNAIWNKETGEITEYAYGEKPPTERGDQEKDGQSGPQTGS